MELVGLALLPYLWLEREPRVGLFIVDKCGEGESSALIINCECVVSCCKSNNCNLMSSMSTSVMFFVQLWLNNQRGLCNVRMSMFLVVSTFYLKSRSGGVELEVRRIFCDLKVATTSKFKFDD